MQDLPLPSGIERFHAHSPLTENALNEAAMAVELGYDAGLVSMGGLSDLTEKEHLARVHNIAEILPVFGFYLQPSIGGKIFSYEFWKAFAEIPNMVAIKLAPFNRYQTIDVVRAICSSSRREEIALYTGNDDSIIQDLLTTYRFDIKKRTSAHNETISFR